MEGCESLLFNKHSYSVQWHVKTKHKNINARIKCGMWDKDLKASARVHMVDIHEAEENNVPCPQCDSMWKSRKRMIHHKIVHN